MKLISRERGKEIPVMVISENMMRYGVVIGTSDNVVGILLNTGDYIDEQASKVKRVHKLRK
ncbi:hypothetical protein [Lacrimispora aerotolerans]|uniref:hypothetical protein n=1 Tax=Lacrimispora aerotolerans TaxID=36832 RepID=UPI00047B7406|nr:hypothetical protein [Lacrimispora aerotolerans]